jgi:choline kinase
LVQEKSICFEAVFFDEKPWYEIDTINDLAEAEKLFSQESSKKINCLIN